MHYSAILIAALLLWPLVAQKPDPQPAQPRPPAAGIPDNQTEAEKSLRKEPSPDEGPKDFGTLEHEMIGRANIAFRDAEHKRMVKAAEDILHWSEQLATAKPEGPRLGRSETVGLLQEIEKSARRIVSISGAETTADRLENPPVSWAEGLKQLEATASRLVEGVKKTRRQVVSIPVIADSDALISLSRLLREWARTTQ